jgi:MoxR-like ATPase
VTIPELGTMAASRRPMVFLTSNDTRDLSEALRRRALYLRIDYPTIERERDILLARVPGLSVELADQVARIVTSIRRLDLKKPPSISEAIDWARTLVLLGAGSISRSETPETLHVMLKYEADIEKARVELAGGTAPASGPRFVDDFRRPGGAGQ